MVIARMEQYLSKSDRMRVEIEELESLLGPEDLALKVSTRELKEQVLSPNKHSAHL